MKTEAKENSKRRKKRNIFLRIYEHWLDVSYRKLCVLIYIFLFFLFWNILYSWSYANTLKTEYEATEEFFYLVHNFFPISLIFSYSHVNDTEKTRRWVLEELYNFHMKRIYLSYIYTFYMGYIILGSWA